MAYARYDNIATDKYGNGLANASVAVYVQPAAGSTYTGPATIYSDASGTVSPNPLTADAYGNYNFYAASGIYTIVVTSGGVSFTQTDVAISNFLYADQFGGADIGARIANAIAALPSTGGVVDAHGFTGTQTCANNPFAGVTKPVQLILGVVTINSSVSWAISSSNISIEGAGKTKTTLNFQGASGTLTAGIAISGTVNNIRIEHIAVTSSATNAALRGISVIGTNSSSLASSIVVRNCLISGCGQSNTVAGKGGLFIENVDGMAIEDNEFTNNGSIGISGSYDYGSYDIVTGYDTSANKRLSIRRNYIHGSNANQAVMLFDASYSEVSDNLIDQNNKVTNISGNITSMSSDGAGLVTVVMSSPQTFLSGIGAGQTITVSGSSNAAFNTTKAGTQITWVDTTHFTYTGGAVSQSGTGGFFTFRYNNDGYGVAIYKTAGFVNQPEHNIVAHNHIRNSGGDGIYVQTSNYTNVIGNNIENCSQQDYDGLLAAAGISVNGGNNINLTGNNIDTSAWHGIQIIGSATFVAISGGSISNVTNNGIYLADSGSLRSITGVAISGGLHGIYAANACSDTLIANCVCKGWGGTGGGGIYFASNVSDISVIGNNVSSPSGAGQGIIFVGSTATRNVISGNIVNMSGGTGSSSGIDYRGVNGTITGNSVYSSPGAGISLNSTTDTGTLIAGNTVLNSTTYGILATAAGQKTLQNNVLLGNTSGAVNASNLVSVPQGYSVATTSDYAIGTFLAPSMGTSNFAGISIGTAALSNFNSNIVCFENVGGAGSTSNLATMAVFGASPMSIDGTGRVTLPTELTLSNITTATTVGAAGAATALPANPVGYITVNIKGTNYKLPYYNV